MKNKIIVVFLLVLTILFGVKTTKVFAGNGPSDVFSFINFYNPDGYDDSDTKTIYEPEGAHNDAFEGATYDKESNTLTLNNVKSDLNLSINEMGEDFKINLVGENEIPFIVIYGFEYGGNLEIIGNGSLTVNKDKEYEIGIVMAAEGTVGKFEVANTATVKVYGSENALVVNYSTEPDNSKVIVLNNGQDISNDIKSGVQTDPEVKSMRVIALYESGNVEYKVATKDGKKYAVSGEEPCYVTRQTLAEVGDYYIFDSYSNTTGEYNENYDNLEALEAAGYTLTDEQVVISHYPSNFGNFPVAQTADGTQYIYTHMYNQNNQESYNIYEITNTKITLADGNEYTYIILTDKVTKDELTDVIQDRVSEGYYSHVVNLKALEINPGEVKVEVKADDNKSDNDKAAASAVNDLLEDAENGKKVSGISETLLVAITEAIENGDEVSVELETNNIDSKDVSDEIKEKVEKTIKEEKTLKDANILGYFDINLLVKVNDDALDEKVTELNKEIEVKVDVSDLVKKLDKVADNKVRKYYVIRIHDGKTDVIEATLNDDNTLSFKTDRFSSYIVTYKDVDASETNPKTLDNINLYVSLISISIIGLFISSLYLKKRNN